MLREKTKLYFELPRGKNAFLCPEKETKAAATPNTQLLLLLLQQPENINSNMTGQVKTKTRKQERKVRTKQGKANS